MIRRTLFVAFLFFGLSLAEGAWGYERIVSLKPGVTETLFALGLGEKVAGVTDYCREPPAARALPKIGGYATPNLERILALHPDLVVMIPDSTPPKIEEAIRKGGIETLVVPGTGIEDVYRAIQDIAGKTGVPERGKDLVAGMRKKMKELRAGISGRPPLRSLIVVQRRPLIVAGGGTFLDELATLAGTQNIAGGSSIPYPQFGMEMVLERQPEVIIDLDPSPASGFWGRFRSIPAVREGRIFPAPQDLFVPGPRLPEALSFLIRTIYGEKTASP